MSRFRIGLSLTLFIFPFLFVQNVFSITSDELTVTATTTITPAPTEEMKYGISPIRPDLRSDAITQKYEMREKIKKEREEFKAQVEEKRKAAMEERKLKREEFKTKLMELKDKKKAAIVERIDIRLNNKNQQLTSILIGHLDRISIILDKVQEKINSSMQEDKKSIEDKIVIAREAITQAQTIVKEQSGVNYELEFDTEEDLKEGAQEVIQKFREDMKKSTDAVKKARELAVDAVQTNKSIIN